jgi:hypothetical protein
VLTEVQAGTPTIVGAELIVSIVAITTGVVYPEVTSYSISK